MKQKNSRRWQICSHTESLSIILEDFSNWKCTSNSQGRWCCTVSQKWIRVSCSHPGCTALLSLCTLPWRLWFQTQYLWTAQQDLQCWCFTHIYNKQWPDMVCWTWVSADLLSCPPASRAACPESHRWAWCAAPPISSDTGSRWAPCRPTYFWNAA